MARDRQRAKQRRRRHGGANPAAGRHDERVPEGTTPAPDPLDNATPWVDEAKLAEAGAEVPGPREGSGGDGVLDPGEVYDAGEDGVVYEDEVPDEASFDDDRAEDAAEELQPAGARTRARRPAAPGVAHERRPERRGRHGRVITFLGHCVDELKRVQWPDRRQTGQGTAVTLGFVVLAGGYLGLMDAIWKPIVEAII